MKTHVIDKDDFDNLKWHQRPQDAGHTIDVRYASDGDWLYQRVHDKETHIVTMLCFPITDSETDREPWKSHIPDFVDDEHVVLVD